MNEAWIIDGKRSPRALGKYGKGSLSHIHPQRCLAQVLNSLRDSIDVDVSDIDDIVMGNVEGLGKHAMDIARMSALDAGWPVSVPGVTLNRFCGSGQQAVTYAAMGVMSGQQDLVVAGGVEFMSQNQFAPPNYFHAGNDDLLARFPLVPQGISADLIATLEGFRREDCDDFAVTSQARAAAAAEVGLGCSAIVPIRNVDGTVALAQDELLRPETTMEALSQLRPSFLEMGASTFGDTNTTFDEMALSVYPEIDAIEHIHHAGNSSGVADGASALLIASPEYATAHGLKPRARIIQTAVAGTEPVIMLTGPGPAAELCLRKAGMSVSDIDLWEVNEAFAAVVLKFVRDLEVDTEKVNVFGGAIALGHPIGATGGILIQTAIEAMEALDKSTALIAMCTGGGMGTATIIERITR